MRTSLAMIATLSMLGSTTTAGQELIERVERAPDGVVLFSYPAKPGVCGYDENIYIRRSDRNGGAEFSVRRARSADDADWQSRCVEGPVRVRLNVRGGTVTDVETRVGTDFVARPGDRQLGALSASDAVDLLIGIASRTTSGAGDDALFPTTLAAGVEVHPRLIQVAADPRVPRPTRERAVFWAAETGALVPELSRLYATAADEKLREQIIFAYHRAGDRGAVQELLRIARGADEVGLRKKAVFWLGQAAGREITGQLGAIAEGESTDIEVREHAVFALSQRPREEGIPALINIAQTSRSPRLRKKALFWLGQSGDPRAIGLFEEILLR